mmetsp:Transcript_28694/g.54201  ORF Transcript_28694/g.54201 Transcript_28694/m.54201 type:complete len:205 (+) Transcript_28694:221-835(+)
MWTNKRPLMHKMHHLRRGVDVIFQALVGGIGRKESGKRQRQIGQQQEGTRNQSQLVFLKPQPQQPRIGHVQLGASRLCGGFGIIRRLIDVTAIRLHTHRSRPPNRMRGSSSASNRSDTNVPINVSSATNISTKADRNRSCDFSAVNNSGPMVCKPNTTETKTEPEINDGSSVPISATNGLNATRSGYLVNMRGSLIPLARAVST